MAHQRRRLAPLHAGKGVEQHRQGLEKLVLLLNVTFSGLAFRSLTNEILILISSLLSLVPVALYCRLPPFALFLLAVFHVVLVRGGVPVVRSIPLGYSFFKLFWAWENMV